MKVETTRAISEQLFGYRLQVVSRFTLVNLYLLLRSNGLNLEIDYSYKLQVISQR